MAAETTQITIRVPGHDPRLIMRSPEWALLSEHTTTGWQLGGWVNLYDLDTFSALWTADQIQLTHPGEPPVLVSLRDPIHEPSERLMPYGYLKFRAVQAPQPHPAWQIDGRKAGR